MASIPFTINSVKIEFAKTANNNLNIKLVQGLKYCIKSDIAQGFRLKKIFISSISDKHVMPSRHAQEKAVDISRINGTKMVIGYPSQPEIKAIVDAIQTKFESFQGKTEKFGPYLKKKHGVNFSIGGHADHIHLSVD